MPSPIQNRSQSGRRRGGPGRRPKGGASRPHDIEPLHPTADPPEIASFREWDLGDAVQDTIAAMGIVRPTPIQALAIGPVLAGRDIIAKAETGTGKTLAFGAPMMARIDPDRRTVLGLVLSPTRELSEQVHGVLEKLGAARGVRTALIVGGEPLAPQVEALQAGAQVVVGTPGRVLDLMKQGFLSFPWTEYVVLDEADKMLEIGFIDDVKAILAAANDERQTLLFSATFPTPLLRLARESTRDPAEVATALGVATVDTIQQFRLEVGEDDSSRALQRMMDLSRPDDVFLVFCDRRTDVDRLLRRVERGRHPVKALHGGYDQASRFRVMSAFRTGDVKCLLATDVASRGLDVEHVTHVVNYGVPRDPSDYTHRIGRTGRAGREGTAITLVAPVNRRRWQALRAQLPFDIIDISDPRELFERRAPRNAPPAAEESEPRRTRRRRSEPAEAPEDDRETRGDFERAPREAARSEERPPRRRRREPEAEPEPREERDEARPRRRRRGSEPEPDPARTEAPRPARQRSRTAEREPEREPDLRRRREPRRRREREAETAERPAPRRPRDEERPEVAPEERPPRREPRERPPRKEERAERPAREERAEPPAPAPAAGDSFGLGVHSAPAEAERPKKKRPARRKAAVEDAPPETPPPSDSTGFGAGL